RVALAAGASAELIVDAARLVAFSAADVQPAQSDNLVVLRLGVVLVALERFLPLRNSNLIFRALVVEQRHRVTGGLRSDGALSRPHGAHQSLFDALLLG